MRIFGPSPPSMLQYAIDETYNTKKTNDKRLTYEYLYN